jgi:hypothetical protein
MISNFLRRIGIAPLVILALLAFVSGCEGDGEEFHEGMPSTTARPSGQTPEADSHLTPQVTPAPSAGQHHEPSPAAPVPEDWKTFAPEGGKFTVRYPSDWQEVNGHLWSFDPDGWDGSAFPPNSIKVDILVGPADILSRCGNIVLDRGEIVEVESASLAMIDGLVAWETTAEYPAQEGPERATGLTFSQEITSIVAGDCLTIGAYFAQVEPDVSTVAQIIESFRWLAAR